MAVSNFLTEITEWGWPNAPARKLMFRSDVPRLPQPLPKFLPPDADRRLRQALEDHPDRLGADALLLQRACGLRIGELLDLELDAVIDLPGAGSWLKVPPGKLETERMVPIDADILLGPRNRTPPALDQPSQHAHGPHRLTTPPKQAQPGPA